MREEIGLLRANALSEDEAAALADDIQSLIEVAIENRDSHAAYIAENPISEDEADEEFDEAVATLSAVVVEVANVPQIIRAPMTKKEATEAYSQVKKLINACNDLNGYDFFGTEGWQHCIGWDD